MPEQNEEDYEKKARKRLETAIRNAREQEAKKEIAKRFLDDKAYERIMNVRVSNPELYEQMIQIIISLVQQQKVAGKITEKQLVGLLERITARHEPTIEFKHK